MRSELPQEKVMRWANEFHSFNLRKQREVLMSYAQYVEDKIDLKNKEEIEKFFLWYGNSYKKTNYD